MMWWWTCFLARPCELQRCCVSAASKPGVAFFFHCHPHSIVGSSAGLCCSRPSVALLHARPLSCLSSSSLVTPAAASLGSRPLRAWRPEGRGDVGGSSPGRARLACPCDRHTQFRRRGKPRPFIFRRPVVFLLGLGRPGRWRHGWQLRPYRAPGCGCERLSRLRFQAPSVPPPAPPSTTLAAAPGLAHVRGGWRRFFPVGVGRSGWLGGRGLGGGGGSLAPRSERLHLCAGRAASLAYLERPWRAGSRQRLGCRLHR